MYGQHGVPAKKSKKDTVEPQENIDADNETQKALEDIDSCQNEIDSLNEKASEDILRVEQKFNKLRKPFFDKRNEIIGKLPNFWITAFVNHPQMTLILREEEEDLLHYLVKIDVDEYEDLKFGYKITFHFAENPYFENETITKEFFMGGMETRSTSTLIQWKEGKNIIKMIKDEDLIKGKKRTSSSESRGFMTWFVDNSDPALDEIAEIIKDDMWPNPLQYYLAPDIEVKEGLNGDEDEEEEEEGSEDDADDSIVIVEDEEEEGSIIIGSDSSDVEAIDIVPAKDDEAEENMEEGGGEEESANGGEAAEEEEAEAEEATEAEEDAEESKGADEISTSATTEEAD